MSETASKRTRAQQALIARRYGWRIADVPKYLAFTPKETA